MLIFMSLEDISNADALYDGYMEARRGVDWKEAVQQYEANLLLNILHTKKKINNWEYKPKPMTEFKLCERGHVRQIKAQSIYDRVVQRSLNDNVLIPKTRPLLIYDNGASLEGKGLSFGRKRFEIHLRKAYKEFGKDAHVLLMDFLKYYDNIVHDKALKAFSRVLLDDELEFLKISFREFEIDASYMTDYEFKNCLDMVFNAIEYSKIPEKAKTGKKFLKKSVGIGNQSSQITGVLYSTPIDNYCKTVKRIKYYGRYMDDTYIIMKDKEELKSVYAEICEKCQELGIFINQKKTHIYKMYGWLTWLKINYKLTETGGLVRKVHSSSFRRERRRLKKFQKLVKHGRMTCEQVWNCYKSWRGDYEKYDSAEKLRKLDKYFNELFKEAKENERASED